MDKSQQNSFSGSEFDHSHISIPENVKNEVCKILGVEQSDYQVQAILEVFKEATVAQTKRDQMKSYETYSRTEFKQSLTSIKSHLEKVITAIEVFSYNHESDLDVHFSIANKGDLTLLSRPINTNGDSGYLDMLKGMSKAIDSYKSELREGKQRDLTYYYSINLIIKTYTQLYPDKNPMGKSVSDESIISKLVSEWLYGVYLKEEDRKSVRRKIESVTLRDK